MSAVDDALRAADLPTGAAGTEVAVGARRIAVDVTPRGAGLELRCTIAATGEPDPRLGEELALYACRLPGDTAIELAAGGVVLTRTVVQPTPPRLHAAVHGLARAAVSASALLGELATAFGFFDREGKAAIAEVAVAPPALGDPADLLARLEASVEWVEVPAPQPGWEEPDPAKALAGELVPGVRYELVNRVGGWARVRGPDDRVVYTNASTLMEARR